MPGMALEELDEGVSAPTANTLSERVALVFPHVGHATFRSESLIERASFSNL